MQNVQNDVQNRVPINNVERTQDKDRIKIVDGRNHRIYIKISKACTGKNYPMQAVLIIYIVVFKGSPYKYR